MIAPGLLVLVLVLGACRSTPPLPPAVEVPTPELPAEPPWPGTLAAIVTAVDSGRFSVADSILSAFERTEAGAQATTEIAFWRVLLLTDPRNPAFSPARARAALEAYLVSPTALRRTEATVMLRLLATSDSLRAVHTSARTAAEQRDRAREEELQRLRDELQRTQAELERIKRRLGPPKP